MQATSLQDKELNVTDRAFMEQALRLAEQPQRLGEVPVGALVVKEGMIIGRGWNQSVTGRDPTAHAEIIALREAALRLGNYRLTGCHLYTTLEPCAMCAGALVHSRIQRLVYGADDPRAGAAGSVFQIANSALLNHRIEIVSGVLAGPCADLLQRFFQTRREQDRRMS